MRRRGRRRKVICLEMKGDLQKKKILKREREREKPKIKREGRRRETEKESLWMSHDGTNSIPKFE